MEPRLKVKVFNDDFVAYLLLDLWTNKISLNLSAFWQSYGQRYSGKWFSTYIDNGPLCEPFCTWKKSKAIEDSRLRRLCATHCSPPQPNSVVHGEAYGRGMSVSGGQHRDGVELKRWSSAPLCVAYHTSTVHTWCGSSANLECRSGMCCARLAGNAGPKKSPKICHLGTIAQLCRAISLQLRRISTIGKSC